MGNRASRSGGRKIRGGDGDRELFQELSDWFPELKAKPRRSAHRRDVSLELINRSVSFIEYFNRQFVELRPLYRRGLCKDELLSPLRLQFLYLSVGANKFLDSLLDNMKNMNRELLEFLDAILNWTPSRHRREEILEKLRRFQSGQSFSEQFLQLFRELMEQHQEVVEKVRQQGNSLDKKVKTLKWLRKFIHIVFAGFFVTVLICSILAAALHASPVLASIVAAATSAASWGPLALWVDELWVKKLNELQLVVKGLCAMRQGAEDDKERALRELQPIYSLVNKLKQRLDAVQSTDELLPLKERLQKELPDAIRRINRSMEKVEECQKELDRSRDELLNWMLGEGNGDQNIETKVLLLGS